MKIKRKPISKGFMQSADGKKLFQLISAHYLSNTATCCINDDIEIIMDKYGLSMQEVRQSRNKALHANQVYNDTMSKYITKENLDVFNDDFKNYQKILESFTGMVFSTRNIRERGVAHEGCEHCNGDNQDPIGHNFCWNCGRDLRSIRPEIIINKKVKK